MDSQKTVFAPSRLNGMRTDEQEFHTRRIPPAAPSLRRAGSNHESCLPLSLYLLHEEGEKQ